MESLSPRQARRLALVRAGLLRPRLTGLPRRAAGAGVRARRAALEVIGRFGYLQLDTVAVAGARSHSLVLLSRLEGLDPEVGERLLAPGEPLFEYWGHEACWMPLELYPAFEFRRRALDPRWSRFLDDHLDVARRLLERLGAGGPLRSVDLEGERGAGWYGKLDRQVAVALWLRGELAIRERRSFQRVYDLAERVIPGALRRRTLALDDSVAVLLERALAGHGWAQIGTLAATWRLRNLRPEIDAALARLVEEGTVVACTLELGGNERPLPGWIRVRDLELAGRLDRLRPRRDRGVLLSPFDPVLWDRRRVARLFGFDQILEIFKPAAARRYGYFCLPVLAGDRLVARVDLKADRRRGRLRLLSTHWEDDRPDAAALEAHRTALDRHARTVGLRLEG